MWCGQDERTWVLYGCKGITVAQIVYVAATLVFLWVAARRVQLLQRGKAFNSSNSISLALLAALVACHVGSIAYLELTHHPAYTTSLQATLAFTSCLSLVKPLLAQLYVPAGHLSGRLEQSVYVAARACPVSPHTARSE